MSKIKINIEVLKYYVENSQISQTLIQDKIKSFDKWLTQEQEPTFSQLMELAKIINIPVGLFLINQTIKKQYPELLSFRTVENKAIEETSQELLDTIEEMQEKQNFLKENLELSKIPFINSTSLKEKKIDIANKIRKYLDLKIKYFEDIEKDKILNFWREKINQTGVYIFFNGKVKENTHRPLNVKEFRGFVLNDEYAPIIFINQKDTKNAQLFTLVHEFVHLWLGKSEVYNVDDFYDNTKKEEIFINEITAELLMPESIFIKKQENIYKVSDYAILQRKYDLKLIDLKTYNQEKEKLKQEYDEYFTTNKKSNGGNYKNNLKFRMDKNFFYLVDNAIYENKIRYTDAFNILGVSYKGYKTLKDTK